MQFILPQFAKVNCRVIVFNYVKLESVRTLPSLWEVISSKSSVEIVKLNLGISNGISHYINMHQVHEQLNKIKTIC